MLVVFKLDSMLPLMLNEMARVLRRGSGRMVLLCGSYIPILEAFQKASSHGCNVWQLPCDAVFPVNIGGLLAWVIQFSRTSDAPKELPRHVERVLARKRELIAQFNKNDTATKPKRVQSS